MIRAWRHGYTVNNSTLTFLSLPFFAKRQGLPKKGKDQGQKRREISKSLSFCLFSLQFCPKSLHFVFLKWSFDPQKGKDLKCKDSAKMQGFSVSLLKELQKLHSAMKKNKRREKERNSEVEQERE